MIVHLEEEGSRPRDRVKMAVNEHDANLESDADVFENAVEESNADAVMEDVVQVRSGRRHSGSCRSGRHRSGRQWWPTPAVNRLCCLPSALRGETSRACKDTTMSRPLDTRTSDSNEIGLKSIKTTYII